MSEIKISEIPIIGFAEQDKPDLGVINTCVHCGLCLPVCPTYRVTGSELASPRGRIYLMKGVSEGRVSIADDTFMDQMGMCLNCRACEALCPSGVTYGNLLEASRAQVLTFRQDPPAEVAKAAVTAGPSKKVGFVEKQVRGFVFGALFKNMGMFRTFSWLMKAYQRTGLQAVARSTGILKLLGMRDMEGMLPPISKSFTVPKGQVFQADAQMPAGDSAPPPAKRVALLTGCIMSTAFDHVHQATIRVLQKNGCEVVLPQGQGCCGALHTHGGDLEGGRELARRNIAALEPLLDELDAIIINAAGCGSTLKEYGHLLHEDAQWRDRAARFAAKIKDVHEYLASLELNTRDLKPLKLKVTYQEPCHMAHAQRITAQPRKLLKAIPELKLVEMFESALCCGSAGIYNVTQPDMAAQLGERKIENALATGADVIATGNPGCALQLANELRKKGRDVKVKYIVELLDESYRGV